MEFGGPKKKKSDKNFRKRKKKYLQMDLILLKIVWVKVKVSVHRSWGRMEHARKMNPFYNISLWDQHR